MRRRLHSTLPITDCKKKLEKVSREHKVESAFMTQRLTHFEVKFNSIETYNIAWDILKLLDDAYCEIGGEYDEFPQERFTVIIYAGREFDEALMMPDWIAGLYDDKIRIRLGDLKAGLKNCFIMNILMPCFTTWQAVTFLCG